jgi:predicted AlkP superfamily phosphohydrolase/phosphomutase
LRQIRWVRDFWRWLVFLSLLGLGVLVLPFYAQLNTDRNVVILGVDGLDPRLLQQFLDGGYLPNFERLISQGDFAPLQTSMPPQSPVAWSTFITGMDPGGHGIYDFIHRDPQSMRFELSMSKVLPPSRTLGIGSWELPLAGGRVELLRRGTAFWQMLDDIGVQTTVFRMPANFPPAASTGRSLSGMGTPDILGTPGTFSFYTAYPPIHADDISGGRIHQVEVKNQHVVAQLIGPENTFRRTRREKSDAEGGSESETDIQSRHPNLKADFEVFIDPDRPLAKLVVQDREFVLREGEWSDWVRVDFEAIPLLVGVSATARFYLQEVRPNFKLYVTPLQINPEDPAMPISTPEDWSEDLCEQVGYFYTQELPEDTKAFSGGIFSGLEFWDQSQFVLRERQRLLSHILSQYRGGLLFFYFSSVDQGCHMLWHYMDGLQPEEEKEAILKDGIRRIYQQIDDSLGQVMDAIEEDTTLIVMSDHGFAPFKWEVNLNSWLAARGYVSLIDTTRRGGFPQFANVDWEHTQAYALGLNGLYVNLKGREKQGIVSPGKEYTEVLDRLEKRLLEMVDRRNGENPVSLVVRPRRDFHGPYVDAGPDLIVGYNWGYRSSWQSPLGEFPRGIVLNNEDAWSGDHCVDYRLVPGVLISNHRITIDKPALYDLTVAVLDEYGVRPLPEMLGRDCLADPGR